MTNRFNSIFGQILHIFSRREFFETVYATQAERGAKNFICWDQFVAMLFCQLGQAHSLREICGGLSSCFGKAKHLGLPKAPRRSTLSYANEHRPWPLYEKTFYQLLGKCRQPDFGKRRFRFKNKLFSLDATVIELCASLFDWAKYRQTKGAVKLHLLLDHDGYLPIFAHITESKVHELTVAQAMTFSPGTIAAYLRVRPASMARKIFVSEKGESKGQSISIRGIQRRMERYARNAKIKLSCHHLRHTMATQMLNADADLSTIQDLLGQ